MNENYNPEDMRYCVMNVHILVIDAANKSENTNSHQHKYDNGQKRYFIAFYHLPFCQCFGKSPMLPDMNEHQRIPRYAYNAVQRPPRSVVCRMARG